MTVGGRVLLCSFLKICGVCPQESGPMPPPEIVLHLGVDWLGGCMNRRTGGQVAGSLLSLAVAYRHFTLGRDFLNDA